MTTPDHLVPNKSRNEGLIQRNVAPSWVLGNAKWDLSSTNLRTGLLYYYTDAESVYHCPSDKSPAKGSPTSASRIRSYSLSGWLGGDIAGKGVRGDTTTEPRLKARLGAIRRPSITFGFLDEHEEGIDDGLFLCYDPIHWTEPDVSSELKTWWEMPSDRHNRGCSLSFADGHSEHWTWNCPKVFTEDNQRPASDLDQADLKRLQGALPTP